jgi:hypothetical protein
VVSLPVQDLPLNRGDAQITRDFIGHLKSFSVSGPSIDPRIDKCASIAVSDIDVAEAFRIYFPTIPLDLNQKPPTFPTTHFLSRINDFRQFVSVHFKHVIALVFGSPDNTITAADFARNILGQEGLRGTQTLAIFQQEVQRFVLAALAKADVKLGAIFFGTSGSTFETPGGFTPMPIPNFHSTSPRKLIEGDVKGWAEFSRVPMRRSRAF